MNEFRQLIENDVEFYKYVRLNPFYIRMMYRDESFLPELIERYKVDTHKTFGDRVEKIGQLATMAQMFF